MDIKRTINIKQVAGLAGVSPMTVSRYFNQPSKLSSEALKRVGDAIETLNYVPNHAARTLLRGKTDTIAFVGHLAHHFDFSILRGIEDCVYDFNYLLFLCNTDSQRRMEGHFISGLIQHRVDGVIINPRYNRDNVLLLQRHRVPTVVVDPKLPNMPFDSVRGDFYEAGYLLTKKLLASGFKHIAFVGGPKGVTSLEERLRGYKTAMKEKKQRLSIHLGEYSRESGYKLAQHLLTKNHTIDVFIAANGLVARGILEALKRLNLHPQKDIKVAAFDAAGEYFDFENVLIANAVQSAHDLGHHAGHMLIERIQGYSGPPREKILAFQIVTNI